MIKKEDVKFLYKRYYVPSYNGIDAVTILKLDNDYEAYVKGRNYTYNIPLAHMYKTKDEALQGKGAWCMYQQFLARNRKLNDNISKKEK